jgi:hypothetical protein
MNSDETPSSVIGPAPLPLPSLPVPTKISKINLTSTTSPKAIFHIVHALIRVGSRYSRIRSLSTRSFLLNVSVDYIAASLLMMVILTLAHTPSRTDLQPTAPAKLLRDAVILGPLIETLLFQMLSFAIVSRITSSFRWRVFWVMAPFTIGHFFVGIGTGLQAGLVLGFYLSYIYVSMSKISIASAFYLTAGFHAINNLIFVSLLLHLR